MKFTATDLKDEDLIRSKFNRSKTEVNWEEIDIEGISEDFIPMLVSQPYSFKLQIVF
jgi:hypothetical protein